MQKLTYCIIVSGLGLLCNGFLIRNPLRNIVVTKAIASSVVENLSAELFDNTVIINQLYCLDCSHNYFVFYFVGFLWYKLYGSGGRGGGPDRGDNKKLVVFKSYLITRRITRQILWVLLLLLTKNVENVY